MKPQVTVITLGVTDLPRARAFYADGLGLRPSSSSNEHIAFFPAGGVVLALYGRDSLAQDAHVEAGARPGFAGFTLAHNVGSKTEVDAALEAARLAGARITKPAEEAFWGGYSGYFADPDGYLWEVAWNPYWSLTPDGRVALPE